MSHIAYVKMRVTVEDVETVLDTATALRAAEPTVRVRDIEVCGRCYGLGAVVDRPTCGRCGGFGYVEVHRG